MQRKSNLAPLNLVACKYTLHGGNTLVGRLCDYVHETYQTMQRDIARTAIPHQSRPLPIPSIAALYRVTGA